MNLQSYDFIVYQWIDGKEIENYRFTASKWKEFKNNLVDYMKRRGEPSKVLMFSSNVPIAIIDRQGVEIEESLNGNIKEVLRLFDWDMIIMYRGICYNRCVYHSEYEVKWMWRNGYNAFNAI